MSDIYLSLTETPSVVTLSQPVIGSSVAATVTVGNTVTVALDANSLSALENVTVTVGAAVSISNFPASQTIAGTVTANVAGNLNDTIEIVSGNDNVSHAIAVHLYSPEGIIGTSNHPVPISGTVTANVGGIASGVTIPVRLYAEKSGESPSGQDTLVLCDSGGQLLINAQVAGQSVLGYDGNPFVQVKQVAGSSVTIGSLPAISGTVTANVAGNLNSTLEYDGSTFFVKVAGRSAGGKTDYPINISGTVTVGAMPSGALTTRFGSVTTANLATLTSAVTNTSRKFLLVQNIATSTVTIGIGFAPTTTQGIQLTAGAGLTFDAFCPTGGVWWLSGVTSSNFCVIEG